MTALVARRALPLGFAHTVASIRLVPIFADQFENSKRVSAAGAAITVDGPDVIAEGIGAVLDSVTYRDRARAIAAEVAAAPSPDEVLDEVLSGVG